MADRTCEGCGALIAGAIGRGRPRRFCLECRPRTYEPKVKQARAHKAKRVRTPNRRVCVECWGLFSSRGKAKCCPSCQVLLRMQQRAEGQAMSVARRRSTVTRRPCAACEEPIAPGRSRFCSQGCADTGRIHVQNGWPLDRCLLIIRDCPRCSHAFVVRRGLAMAKFCEQCRPVAERDRVVDKNHRRRMAVDAGEFVRLSVLAQRDSFRCQLCSAPVDMGLRHPDPMSPSIDHIIPLSKGGEHTMANTQLAHLHCNMSKGNRPAGEQLRLVG